MKRIVLFLSIGMLTCNTHAGLFNRRSSTNTNTTHTTTSTSSTQHPKIYDWVVYNMIHENNNTELDNVLQNPFNRRLKTAGYYPIHLAVFFGDNNTVNTCCKYEIDINVPTETTPPRTATDIAAKKGLENALRILKSYDANPDIAIPYIQDTIQPINTNSHIPIQDTFQTTAYTTPARNIMLKKHGIDWNNL